MASILQVVLSCIITIFVSSLVFGLWLSFLAWIYVLLHGSIPIEFFGASSLSRPIWTAMILGMLFGAVHGLLTALIVIALGGQGYSRNILFSLVGAEMLIILIFVFFSLDFNPLEVFAEVFISRPGDLVRTSLIMAVPATAVGLLLKVVNSLITSH